MGRPEAATLQDIQLSGLGIMKEHCVVDIEEGEVHITPRENARYHSRKTCSKTKGPPQGFLCPLKDCDLFFF